MQKFHGTGLPVLLIGMFLTGSALSDGQTDTTVEKSEACISSGNLAGSVFGAIEGQLDWQTAAGLSCDGMPRPAGQGARLRFAGPHPDGEGSLALIIALPDTAPGESAKELVSRVTLIEEASGRFFSTREQTRCWTDLENSAVSGQERELVTGTLYCIGPLAEINGDAAVVLGDLQFSGFIDWSQS